MGGHGAVTDLLGLGHIEFIVTSFSRPTLLCLLYENTIRTISRAFCWGGGHLVGDGDGLERAMTIGDGPPLPPRHTHVAPPCTCNFDGIMYIDGILYIAFCCMEPHAVEQRYMDANLCNSTAHCTSAVFAMLAAAVPRRLSAAFARGPPCLSFHRPEEASCILSSRGRSEARAQGGGPVA